MIQTFHFYRKLRLENITMVTSIRSSFRSSSKLKTTRIAACKNFFVKSHISWVSIILFRRSKTRRRMISALHSVEAIAVSSRVFVTLT